MSKYNRIVSYLYQYTNGIKGQNIGYARIEQKGQDCRITVQMRVVAVESMPEVYLYRQGKEGIEYISIGKMEVQSGNIVFKINTQSENVCGSGEKIYDMEGIVLYISENRYFGTSWINDEIFIGRMKNLGGKVEGIEHQAEKNMAAEKTELKEKAVKEVQLTKDTGDNAGPATEPMAETQVTRVEMEENTAEPMGEQETAVSQEMLNKENTGCSEEASDIMATSTACGSCPFKNQNMNFGEKMMSVFPEMYPFKSGLIHRSVKIEPKDIGCLPINMWSLSNNKFLLQGYYCYRHLIFVEMSGGNYAIGVPGIYSDTEYRKAKQFGFGSFQSLGEETNRQGAFGYWLFPLKK